MERNSVNLQNDPIERALTNLAEGGIGFTVVDVCGHHACEVCEPPAVAAAA